MASQKQAVGLINVINNFLHNFPRLVLTNLLFAVPAAVFFGIFYAVYVYSGINSVFILFLTVIPLFPFYAGVTQVTAHMVKEEEKVNVVSNFIAGVKDNFPRFLVHGAVFYLAIVFSWFSISLYSRMGAQSGIFYLLLAVSIIVAVFFLFAFFYVPSMTVTFDISMKHIYKNSALMTFGELKNNIIAVFGLIVATFFSLSIVWICGQISAAAIIVSTVLLLVFFVPSLTSFVINSAVYKKMYLVIADADSQIQNINQKIADQKNRLSDGEEELEARREAMRAEAEDLLKLDLKNVKDDEYVFYKGKMIKKSVLIKMQQEVTKKES